MSCSSVLSGSWWLWVEGVAISSQPVEGLDFHKFYFDLGKALKNSSGARGPAVRSTIVAPKVVLLGTNAGVVTYTQLQQIPGSPKAGHTSAHNETRVWERQKNDAGE